MLAAVDWRCCGEVCQAQLSVEGGVKLYQIRPNNCQPRFLSFSIDFVACLWNCCVSRGVTTLDLGHLVCNCKVLKRSLDCDVDLTLFHKLEVGCCGEPWRGGRWQQWWIPMLRYLSTSGPDFSWCRFNRSYEQQVFFVPVRRVWKRFFPKRRSKIPNGAGNSY